MKKILIVILLFFALSLAGCYKKTSAVQNIDENKAVPEIADKTNVETNKYPTSGIDQIADKVQVFLFHGTQRCATCVAIGKFANETVSERFKEEQKTGQIEFREINIDLPANKELARKFQASGSALYLNGIRGDVDNIAQDTNVWRLTGDATAFKDYLEGRINILLGR